MLSVKLSISSPIINNTTFKIFAINLCIQYIPNVYLEINVIECLAVKERFSRGKIYANPMIK